MTRNIPCIPGSLLPSPRARSVAFTELGYASRLIAWARFVQPVERKHLTDLSGSMERVSELPSIVDERRVVVLVVRADFSCRKISVSRTYAPLTCRKFDERGREKQTERESAYTRARARAPCLVTYLARDDSLYDSSIRPSARFKKFFGFGADAPILNP